MITIMFAIWLQAFNLNTNQMEESIYSVNGKPVLYETLEECLKVGRQMVPGLIEQLRKENKELVNGGCIEVPGPKQTKV